MSIVYTLICKGYDKVLCEYTEHQGNFEQVSRNLLKKVQMDNRATFSYEDEYFFHYINNGGLIYMCMCDHQITQDTAFSYLEEIKTLFLDTFSPKEIENAIGYCFDEGFRDSIRGKMNYYNANLNESNKVAKLKKGVFEYKDTVLQANDVLMERGDKLSLIIRKADNLRTESQKYLYGAKKVKTSVRCRNYKIIIFGIVCVLLIAYFISAIACGWDWSKCSSDSS